jgi:hypothetical protein
MQFADLAIASLFRARIGCENTEGLVPSHTKVFDEDLASIPEAGCFDGDKLPVISLGGNNAAIASFRDA